MALVIMGDWELVPKKVEEGERWAYGGDSLAGNGYRGKNNPNNTDIGTQISEFTGGRIQFDNYGRISDTTGGMLGQYQVRGKRRDMLGKMLERPYDGIIIQVGVNDLSARAGQDEGDWQRYKGKMRKNIITMYVRAYLKGAGTGNREQVLARIDAAIGKIEKEQAEARELMEGQESWTMQKTLEILSRGKEILEEAREVYKRLSKGAKKPGKALKRIVFVEAAPWKGYETWSEKKGLRTFEYNRMLDDIGVELNDVFGGVRGPAFEVAKIYDSLVSPEDGMKLYREYPGWMKKGKDYLHFDAGGRRAAAAAIALGQFPEYVPNKDKVGGIASANHQPAAGKRPGPVARR